MNFVLALIMGAFIGGAAGYTGSLMVTKRMALAGGALGHLTLPGVALGLMYGFDVSLGAFLFLAMGISLIWWFRGRTSIPMEALTGVVFASSLSIAFLFLPEEHTFPALIGDISQISIIATFFTVVFSLSVFFMVKRIYPEMILSSISEDVAQSEGVSIRKYNFVYLLSVAIVVALGVRVVGSLLTAALVAIPASTSRNLSKNHFQYSYGSLALGGLASGLGILVFKFTGTSIGPITVSSPGPLIIIISALFFVVSLFVRSKFSS